MKRVLFSIALAVVLTRCGGKETVASKSAAALREAQKLGRPIGPAEHGHGAVTPGQGFEVDHAAMGHGSSEAPDHAAMGHGSAAQGQAAGSRGASTQDHAAMGHTTVTQDHAAMASSAAAQDHASMGHATGTQGQSELSQDHAAMGQATASQDHGAMGHGTATPAQTGAHAGHGSASGVIPPGGLWGSVPGALVNAAAPARESSATSRLQRDALDQAAPIAVEEANKAAGAPSTTSTHGGHNQ